MTSMQSALLTTAKPTNNLHTELFLNYAKTKAWMSSFGEEEDSPKLKPGDTLLSLSTH